MSDVQTWSFAIVTLGSLACAGFTMYCLLAHLGRLEEKILIFSAAVQDQVGRLQYIRGATSDEQPLPEAPEAPEIPANLADQGPPFMARPLGSIPLGMPAGLPGADTG